MRNSLEEKNKITIFLKFLKALERIGKIICTYCGTEQCHRNVMIVFIYKQGLLQSKIIQFSISTSVKPDGINFICRQRRLG